MLHEEKKAAKIVEELTMFFFGIGSDEMCSSIKVKEEKLYITFQANYAPELAYKLQAMEDFLKAQKNDGVEDIYWELAGSGDPGETSQLLLIGMMVDKAEIIRKEGQVIVHLEKQLKA